MLSSISCERRQTMWFAQIGRSVRVSRASLQSRRAERERSHGPKGHFGAQPFPMLRNADERRDDDLPIARRVLWPTRLDHPLPTVWCLHHLDCLIELLTHCRPP
jgi:hypothetical protein